MQQQLSVFSMRSFRLTREKRIERVEGEQKRGEEREQTRETQGFAFARRRPHDDDEEEEEIEEEGNEFCVFTALKMEELFTIAVSLGEIVRNRGFSH